MNEVLRTIEQRSSTRIYAEAPVTEEERGAILSAAFRAPTAGNMMLYSIVEVADQALKDRLAVTCDHQPFIAKAPWVLVFVADYQRWMDLFAVSGVDAVEGVEPRTVPGLGDLLLASADAIIAAQNAVVAAESLGIGSCYIGDVIENAEEVAELLALPNHTVPVAMLCFGHLPEGARRRVERDATHVVHRDRYRRLDAADLAAWEQRLQAQYAPKGLPEGTRNYGQAVYRRKFAAAFTHEMNRSAAVWLQRWSTPEPPAEG